MRDHIIAEIRRLATANGGQAPGNNAFVSATGIGEAKWRGKSWARWGDALIEAGFQPKALSDEMHRSLSRAVERGAMPRPRLPASPFRYFNSSPEVIRLVVMMYVRFPLSLRNVEDLLFERGIDICHETVRHGWNRFGPMFTGDIRRQRVSRRRAFRHWRWHLDEMYVKLNGEMVTGGGRSTRKARFSRATSPKPAIKLLL